MKKRFFEFFNYEIFRLYDIDNNGVIDVDEMTEIIEILDTFSINDPESPIQSPKERAESLIKFMDVDNSGGITFDEFIKVCEFSIWRPFQ